MGLALPIDDVEGDPEIVVEARNVLSDGIRRIADEIRNSLDYYRSQPGAANVEAAVLTGRAVAIPAFTETLGQEIGLPLEVGPVVEGRPGAFNGVEPGHLAVAAGLTLDEVPA